VSIFPDGPTSAQGLVTFERDSEDQEKATSLDKTPEGLNKFRFDAVKIEEKVLTRALVEYTYQKIQVTQGHVRFVTRGAGRRVRSRHVHSAGGELRGWQAKHTGELEASPTNLGIYCRVCVYQYLVACFSLS